MSPFGAGIDEFEVDLLEGNSLGVDQHRFPESYQSLSWPHDAALEHQEVLVNLTVMVETTL